MYEPEDELAILRQRQAETDRATSRAELDAQEAGSPAEVIVVTVGAVAASPAPVPMAMYEVYRTNVMVDAEELGAAVTLEAEGDPFLVAHIGSKAPAEGDVLLAARQPGGLWVMRKPGS